jgi:uncharacterized membrane protein (TIGR02234 family)
MPMPTAARREFALTLLLGAAGAGLALLAVRQGWARAVYLAPRPLPSQSITVTGQDLVPAAGALALAGLACLAAVIATRGMVRRGAGVVLALCGAGTAVAVSGSLSTSSVLAAAATKASSSASVASGGTGSTTGGTSPAAGAVVTGGSSAHAVLLGVPWRAAVVASALAIVAAGLLTAWRGARWPVMSSRYERPGAAAGPGTPGVMGRPRGQARGPASGAQADSMATAAAAPAPDAASGRDGPGADVLAAAADPAALWDSISRGDDPTEPRPGEDAAAGGAPGGRTAG